MTEALRAAAELRLPPKAASLTQRGFPRFANFKFSFFDAGHLWISLGATPPRPKGERGLLGVAAEQPANACFALYYVRVRRGVLKPIPVLEVADNFGP